MKRFFAALVFASFLLVQNAFASGLADGLRAYYQKHWDDASQNFQQAMKADPNDSLALVYYIVTTFWLGTSEREIRNLEDALIDNPNDQLTDTRLGYFYYTKSLVHGQKPDKASAELRQAAKLGTSSLVHTGLGIVDFDLGNFNRAKKELARAMDLNAKDVLAYEYMGRILLSFDSDATSALNYFQQEKSLAPNYPDGYYYCASAQDALGKKDEAISDYNETIHLDPLGIGRGLDAHISLGDLYLRYKQYDEARKALKDALAIDPNNQVIKDHLADVDKQQKAKH